MQTAVPGETGVKEAEAEIAGGVVVKSEPVRDGQAHDGGDVVKTGEVGGDDAGTSEVKSGPVAGEEPSAANITPLHIGETVSPKSGGFLSRLAGRAGSVVAMPRKGGRGTEKAAKEQSVQPVGAPAPDVVAGVTAPDSDRVVVGGSGPKEGEEKK
jgi:hypothetical protein